MSQFQSLKIIALIAGIILLGCKTQQSLPEKYRPVVSLSPNGLTFEFKSDHTVSMVGWTDILGQEVAQGTWKYSSKKLWLKRDSLNKDKQLPKNSVIIVVEGFDKSSSKITIRVMDAKDISPIVGAEISFNEEPKTYLADTSGIVLINAISDLEYLRFSYVHIHKSIKVLNQKSNHITLIIDFENMPQLSWLTIPETWKVKGNKLIPLQREGSTELSGELIKY